jgi:hypothetical protein
MNIYSLKYLLLLIFLSIFTASCISKKERPVWNNATFDATISMAPIYTQLDKQKEFFSAHEKQDSLSKKTSAVKYVSKNINTDGINNCRAYYNQSDTLWIDIGISTGLGATGFIIKYKNKKFYTDPYYFTDLITDEPEPTYKIVYQQLTLNKSVYKSGDSLYGHISFKSIETDNNNNKSEHMGKGYFRTIVTATRN